MKAINLQTAVPGPKSAAFLERRKRCVSAGVSVGKSQICASSAEGALITDIDGNTFIDLTGGIGCMNAGHSAPQVVEAVQAQAAKLQHTCFLCVVGLSRQVSCIGEVRGLGAMLAFEVVGNVREPDKEKAEKIALACAQKGVLVLTAGLEGNVIRLLMPLNIKDEHIPEAMNVLHEVITGRL